MWCSGRYNVLYRLIYEFCGKSSIRTMYLGVHKAIRGMGFGGRETWCRVPSFNSYIIFHSSELWFSYLWKGIIISSARRVLKGLNSSIYPSMHPPIHPSFHPLMQVLIKHLLYTRQSSEYWDYKGKQNKPESSSSYSLYSKNIKFFLGGIEIVYVKTLKNQLFHQCMQCYVTSKRLKKQLVYRPME